MPSDGMPRLLVHSFVVRSRVLSPSLLLWRVPTFWRAGRILIPLPGNVPHAGSLFVPFVQALVGSCSLCSVGELPSYLTVAALLKVWCYSSLLTFGDALVASSGGRRRPMDADWWRRALSGRKERVCGDTALYYHYFFSAGRTRLPHCRCGGSPYTRAPPLFACW